MKRVFSKLKVSSQENTCREKAIAAYLSEPGQPIPQPESISRKDIKDKMKLGQIKQGGLENLTEKDN